MFQPDPILPDPITHTFTMPYSVKVLPSPNLSRPYFRPPSPSGLCIFSAQDRDWEEYWRLLFPKVTLSDIKKFEERYKGSEEERDTLKTLYLEKEGNMDVIMEEVSVYFLWHRSILVDSGCCFELIDCLAPTVQWTPPR